MLWAINAGHGGVDTGATNAYVKEKTINLIVANEVKRILIDNGESVLMVRENDEYVLLKDRVNLANSAKADYYVSIHHNAGGGNGLEIIHSIFLGEGVTLSQNISNALQETGQNVRRIYAKVNNAGKDYFYEIRNTTMPAIIVEYGFMDSSDYEAFDTNAELLQEARRIAQGCLATVGKEIVYNTDSEEYTIAVRLFDLGYVTNLEYWASVLSGKTPINLKYLNILLSRVVDDKE